MSWQRILLAVVCGGMLSTVGCGDDAEGSGGTGGISGVGGAGGAGGSTSCDALCESSCSTGSIDPGDDGCMSSCAQMFPDDDCGAEAQAFLDCFEAVECIAANGECQGATDAWAQCVGAVSDLF